MKVLLDLLTAPDNEFNIIAVHRMLELACALARSRGPNELYVLLDASCSSSFELLSRELIRVLPTQNLRVWTSPAVASLPFVAGDVVGRTISRIRAQIILSERPNVVLLCGDTSGNSILPINKWPDDLPTIPTFILLDVSTDKNSQDLANHLSAEMLPFIEFDTVSNSVLGMDWDTYALRVWSSLDKNSTKMLDTRTSQSSRPTLAFVSPVPPQETGIADYSGELAPALATHYEVTVVSEIRPRFDHPIAHLPWLSAIEFANSNQQFDRILYQIGNSPFHIFQIDNLLPRYPGVVVLHDIRLADYRWSYAHQCGRSGRLVADIGAAHGYPALARMVANGLESVMSIYAFSAPVISGAVGLIVHSRHALEILEEQYGYRIVEGAKIINLLRASHDMPQKMVARQALSIPDETFLVCSFGELGPHKLPEIVTGGVAQVRNRTHCEIKLAFVGKASKEYDASLRSTFEELGCSEHVVMTGRTDRSTYLLWLAAADLAIQLRRDSHGESSAALGDCMISGLPVVVNRLGSFIETPPETVYFIDSFPTAENVADAIIEISQSMQLRERLSHSSRHYAENMLSPIKIANEYFNTIESAYQQSPVASAFKMTQYIKHTVPPLPQSEQIAFAQAIASSWPVTRQAQLLIEAPNNTDLIADKECIYKIIIGSIASLRSEVFRFSLKGDLITRRVFAHRLLGLTGPESEVQVFPYLGDVVLLRQCHDIDLKRQNAIARMRVAGVALWLMLDFDSAGPTLVDLTAFEPAAILCVSQRQCDVASSQIEKYSRQIACLSIEDGNWVEHLKAASTTLAHSTR